MPPNLNNSRFVIERFKRAVAVIPALAIFLGRLQPGDELLVSPLCDLTAAVYTVAKFPFHAKNSGIGDCPRASVATNLADSLICRLALHGYHSMRLLDSEIPFLLC